MAVVLKTKKSALGATSGVTQTSPVIHADKVELRDVESLVPYANNARTHSSSQVAQLADSIRQWGWTTPVLIGEDGGILAGHGRVLAAALLKMKRVPTIVAKGWTEKQKRAYILADNQLALNAGWDKSLLSMELDFLTTGGFDTGLLGFSSSALVSMQANVLGLTDDDAFPAPAISPPVSKLGDVWLLGVHRVMCGSSLSSKDLQLLMEGVKARMVWTDPPYLMDYQGAVGTFGNKPNSFGHQKIANDKLSAKDGQQFLLTVAQQIQNWCQGSWYVTFHRLGLDKMFHALATVGLKYRNVIIWKKNNLNLSNSDYKALYEPMIVGWADDYTPIFYGWVDSHHFYGPKGETDVWEVELPSVWDIDKTKKNTLHPTMKPVELVERSIMNSSLPGDIVLDLFGGSGTTLIACTKTNREARLMELDPGYVDTIVRRWQEYTGEVAYLESTGKAFPISSVVLAE